MTVRLTLSLCAALLVVTPSFAQNAAKRGAGTPLLGFGSNSKEPIKVDANRLEVFDKESRAVYSGDVVVVQGQTILRCTSMIVSYAQPRDSNAPRNPGASGQTSIRQIDCAGPVSLLSGTQSATSDKLVYEAEKDIVTLTGKVVIADCDNVQRGERAVYDVKTGRATVDAGPRGRVQGVFTPGGEDAPRSGATPAKSKECPATPGAPRTEAPRPQSGQAPSAPMPLRP